MRGAASRLGRLSGRSPGQHGPTGGRAQREVIAAAGLFLTGAGSGYMLGAESPVDGDKERRATHAPQ